MVDSHNKTFKSPCQVTYIVPNYIVKSIVKLVQLFPRKGKKKFIYISDKERGGNGFSCPTNTKKNHETTKIYTTKMKKTADNDTCA